MRNYLLESQIGLHCFKKRAFDKLSGEQKRRVKTFLDGKRIWKTQEKIKFWFIREPWIYLLVKSRNSQIFYILIVSWLSANRAQEINFYLLVASLYVIWSKFSFIHSFHTDSHDLMNDFESSSSEENITKSCIFDLTISFGDSAPCWNPVEYIQKIIISVLIVPLDEKNYGVRHIL